jgi:hypothetical protein
MKKFLEEVGAMRRDTPVNFFCMIVSLCLMILAGGFFLTSTVVAIFRHENGWTLVFQSFIQTFTGQ